MRHLLLAQVGGEVIQPPQGAGGAASAFQVAGKPYQASSAPVVTTTEQAVSATAPVIPPPTPSGTGDAVANSILGSTMSGYFEMMGYLLLVLAGVWLLFWLLRRSGVGFFSPARQIMAVENRLSLGPKKWVVVARVHGKRMVLGVTDHTISMLTELPEDEAEDHVSLRKKTGSQQGGQESLFKKVVQQGKKAQTAFSPRQKSGEIAGLSQSASGQARPQTSPHTAQDDFKKFYAAAQELEDKKQGHLP